MACRMHGLVELCRVVLSLRFKLGLLRQMYRVIRRAIVGPIAAIMGYSRPTIGKVRIYNRFSFLDRVEGIRLAIVDQLALW